jgi:hypothetical protein
MKTTKALDSSKCLNFLHLSMFIFLTLQCVSLCAREITQLVRMPASAPEEEVMEMPTFDKSIVAVIFADDDAGVMAGMRNSLASWEEKEEYSKKWNLESSGLYATPTTEEKKNMIMNKLLKYADKRLTGEVKNAEAGSALYSVGKVEKSLRPNAVVSMGNNISLKFKARVLQGKAIMEVRNPWIESSASVSAKGELKVITQKQFKDLGFTSGVEYFANDAHWIAYADQVITENIKARVSSTQKDQSILNNDAEKKIEMTASFPVNF